MRISESTDDLYEPRFSNGSLSCLFPSITYVDSYGKLPQEPIGLIILKLDGSSFGIEVARTGTVNDIKRAVESIFSYLPEKGIGTVSWDHVWSQFCLCHDGQKLLIDSDYISLFGIKDGDQLKFIHHSSNLCPESETQETDSDDEHCVSHNHIEEYQINEEDTIHHNDIPDENLDDDQVVLCCQLKFTNLLKGNFRYRKLRITPLRIEERRSSSKHSHKTLWRIRNCLRFSSRNKSKFRRVTRKGE